MLPVERVNTLRLFIKNCDNDILLKEEKDKLNNIKLQLENILNEGKLNTDTIDKLSVEIYQILG